MKKSESFESLPSTVRGQMEVHNTTDLISMVSQKMLIDVTTVFMESMKIKETVISHITDIDTMSGLFFLNSSGHTADILALCDVKYRIKDLVFIKLGCYLDGSTVGRHISQPGIDFQFCFKLPQSSYDPNTRDIIALTTPGTPAKCCFIFFSH